MMLRLLPLLAVLALPAESALAVDVSPSKRTTPQKFIDSGGKRFRIFGGDPSRINKANDFDLKSFKTELNFKENPVSMTPSVEAPDAQPVLTATFSVINDTDKTATLEFPDAQRFDLRVLDPAGNVVYVWSADKVFVEAVGKSIINAKDKISFRQNIPLETFTPAPSPGLYTMEAVLANYPQVTARGQFSVVP
ncbi:MAG: BsuPI-related putative proteinase inhibitor [Verrucomicrobiota bacterium]